MTPDLLISKVRNKYFSLLGMFGLSSFRKADRVPVLTAQQLQFWDENGYLVLKGFVSPERLKALNALIDQAWSERKRAENPLVMDVFIGSEREKRMYFRDVPDEARNFPYKLNDLFLESKLVRDLVLDPKLSRMLEDLLDGEPMVCNSLTFERGSQQPDHFDTFYMPPSVPDKMLATWVALEDVSPDAGPLVYYPGTHKIPPYVFSHGKITAVAKEMPRFYEYIQAELSKRNIKPITFTGNAGDVFIWHGQLLHAGSAINDLTKTRRSIVSHYFRACDTDPKMVRSIGPGRHFMHRTHQKVA